MRYATQTFSSSEIPRCIIEHATAVLVSGGAAGRKSIIGRTGKCATMVCTRRQRSRYGFSSARTTGRFGGNISRGRFRPEGDDGDQARFLIGNHDQAAGKSVYVLQGAGEGGGNGGLDAVGFLGLATNSTLRAVTGEVRQFHSLRGARWAWSYAKRDK